MSFPVVFHPAAGESSAIFGRRTSYSVHPQGSIRLKLTISSRDTAEAVNNHKSYGSGATDHSKVFNG